MRTEMQFVKLKKPYLLLRPFINHGDIIMLSEIDALSAQKGYCFCTNQHFASILGESPRNITKRISKLRELNLIDSKEIRDSRDNTKERRLSVNHDRINELLAQLNVDIKEFEYEEQDVSPGRAVYDHPSNRSYPSRPYGRPYKTSNRQIKDIIKPDSSFEPSPFWDEYYDELEKESETTSSPDSSADTTTQISEATDVNQTPSRTVGLGRRKMKRRPMDELEAIF